MPHHSLCKIWIHAVFSTKDRTSLITQELEKTLFKDFKNILWEQGCQLEIANGTSDHVHLLFLHNPQKSISEVMKMLKGSSSHSVNQQNILNTKFAWQVGYGAFSVSESHIDKVKKYIEIQKEHHHKMTFQEEYDKFLVNYGLLGNNTDENR